MLVLFTVSGKPERLPACFPKADRSSVVPCPVDTPCCLMRACTQVTAPTKAFANRVLLVCTCFCCRQAKQVVLRSSSRSSWECSSTMLNQGLDPQGLRYAAAGTQYQHAQQNFQALGRSPCAAALLLWGPPVGLLFAGYGGLTFVPRGQHVLLPWVLALVHAAGTSVLGSPLGLLCRAAMLVGALSPSWCCRKDHKCIACDLCCSSAR